jgi:Flp pilus assembly protein TadG
MGTNGVSRKAGSPMLKWRNIFRTDGGTLVEFALTAGVMFTLLIGTIEMCFAFYTYHFTASAARQGARWAMVRGSTSCTNTPNLTDCNATAAEIQTYVSDLGFLNIPTSDVTVNWYTWNGTQPAQWTLCSSGTCNAPGNQVQVKVTYPYLLGIPGMPAETINMTSTSQVVISQ